MTPIRNAALKLSAFVTRHASPGWEEWLAGLNREMDFIESDWKALAWAAGSTRVLLDPRPAPIRTYADLIAAAKQFASLPRRLADHMAGRSWPKRNNLSFSLLLVALQLWVLYLCHSGTQTRAGYGVLMVVCVAWSIVSLARRRNIDVPDDDNSPALVSFYRNELQRRSGLTSAGFCLPVLLLAALGTGIALTISARWIGFLLSPLYLVAAFVILLIAKGYRNNRRRLHQIDAILAQTSQSSN